MAFKYSKEQLERMDHELVISLFLGLQEQISDLTKETKDLNEKMQKIMEQLVLEKDHRFGRSSEKMNDNAQIMFLEVDGKIVFFNEAEAVSNLETEEPDSLEINVPRGKKKAGRKATDLSKLQTNIIEHYMKEEELVLEFGENGWKQLPDAISKRYRFVPAKVEVDEHHIGVYASKSDGRMIKAEHPSALLHASAVSPSLGAAVMNGKYVNAVPLYRLEKEFERYGLAISRQNMANWMIRLSEEYLGVLYDYLHKKLYDFPVIQADETPVLVNRDGRKAGSKSFMWVYRSGYMYKEKQVVLYEYQKTRNTTHPRDFLRNYKGVCVTDGYQVYHTLEKELEDLKISGCYAHVRRRFDEAVKVLPEAERKKSMAYLVMKQIQAIYREEKKLKDVSSDERLRQRQLIIKPLVEALFLYLKEHEGQVPKSGKLRDAFRYALNQEPYLKVFLENGNVPLDNNASERAIRGFCIGKKNWQVIDTIRGAKSSAIIYSIAETAKASQLKPYEYFEYLLEEIPKHMEETDTSFLEDLLPWSKNLPTYIKKS